MAEPAEGRTTDELLEAFLASARANADDVVKRLEALRWAVLRRGMGDPASADSPYRDPATYGTLTQRGRVWKALLGVGRVDEGAYRELVSRGQCVRHLYEKIRGDTFRTFPNEPLYNERVAEQANVRILCAFVHKYGGGVFSYRQGMNAIAAALLFCMPEPDAFHAFAVIVLKKIPLYWLNDISGSTAGCALVDEVITAVDPKLGGHLRALSLGALLYAHPCVSSLCTSVPPFNEMMQLWDFLIAFGPHMNILCVAAQVVMIRERLLASDRMQAKTQLDYRNWPELSARAVISMTMSILPRVPAKLMARVQAHATDANVCQSITKRPVTYEPVDL